MAANTGPDSNTYIIPEVDLADTFNVWRDTTNTQTFKLNKMRVYDGVSSDTIEVTVGGGGTLQAQLASTINKGLTFTQPVVFSNGVTFNGDVTFNAQTFTVNANNVTIDDYAILLGATLGANDTNINAAGGGGLLLNRGSSNAAWVWRADTIQGFTGVWNANAHIGLCGATAGLYPDQGGVLPIHGSGIRLAGSASGTHGLQMNLTNGSGSDSVVSMLRYSPAGSTVFAEVLNGTTYGSRPFFNIPNGANRKMVRTVSAHGFDFGTVVRLDSSGNYVRARADSSDNAEVVGIVSRIDGARDFELTFIGEIFGDFSPVIEGGVPGSSQLQTGKTYYLSPNEGGKITSVQPTTAGLVHKAVLIATGPRSATVIPFTGGLLASTVTVSTVSSVATRLKQLNRFKVGDILRFKAVPGGITLTYDLSDRVVQERYTHGVYYRAQANSAEDATVAGMVIRVDEPEKGLNYQTNPEDVVWREFDILMDGWFDGLSNLTPGKEYWLALGSVGAGPAGEGVELSYNESDPSGSGQVRKKLFMATTPTSGYLYSYRGDVLGSGEGNFIEIIDPLVKNLASGTPGDLKIGVYSGGVNGGRPSIIISKTPTTTDGVGSKIGNVGIGLDQWSLYQSGGNGKRILAGLDLVGWMRVGSTLTDATPAGRDLIVDRIGNDSDPANVAVPQCRIVLGSDHTRGNAVLGYKVRPSATTANTFTSSISGTHDRSALVLGTDGSNPSMTLFTAKGNSSIAAGTSVQMTPVMSIVGSNVPQTTFVGNISVGGRIGIGNSSPQVALDVTGHVRSSIPLTDYGSAPNSTLVTLEYLKNVLPQCVQTHYNGADVLVGPSNASQWNNVALLRANAVEITPLNTSITPRHNTSKILVTFNIAGEGAGDDSRGAAWLLYRVVGGVETIIGDGDGSIAGNRMYGHKIPQYDVDINSTINHNMITYLDSPNTTQTVTYKLKYVCNFHAFQNRQIFCLNRCWNNCYNSSGVRPLSASANSIPYELSTSQCILQEFFS